MEITLSEKNIVKILAAHLREEHGIISNTYRLNISSNKTAKDRVGDMSVVFIVEDVAADNGVASTPMALNTDRRLEIDF